MDGQTTTVVISGMVSLVSAFGSILLKDHLDQRRELRKAGVAPVTGTPNREAVPPSTRRPTPTPVPDKVTAEAAFPRLDPQPADPPPPVRGASISAGFQSRRNRSIARSAGIIIFGLLVGYLMVETSFRNGIGDETPLLLALGIMAIATFALLVHFVRRRNRSLFGYQLNALSLWAAFFGGMSYRLGSIEDRTPEIFAAVGGFFAVLGLIAFGVTYRWGRPAIRP